MALFLTLIALLILISAAIAGLSAAPWLPTKAKDRQHLLDTLDLRPGQTVIDLGAGDGSLLFAVARKFPKVTCIGYDISLLPLALGLTRKILYRRAYKNVHLRFGDLFKQSVAKADLVFIFLLPKSYARLIDKLRLDLKDEATVVVEAWPLPNLEPVQALKKDGCLSLFFYTGKSLRSVK